MTQTHALTPIIILHTFTVLPFLLTHLSLPYFSYSLPLCHIQLIFQYLFTVHGDDSRRANAGANRTLIPNSIE